MISWVMLMIGIALAAPVFFIIGLFAGMDRNVAHERADIRPALRRAGR